MSFAAETLLLCEVLFKSSNDVDISVPQEYPAIRLCPFSRNC